MEMMRRVFFIMALSMALASSYPLPNTANEEEAEHRAATTPSSSASLISSVDEISSFRGINRLLAQYNPRASMTCDKFPRVCRAEGSPGPDCCKKQCVNVMTDNLNCGQCGMRCRYGEACCGGSCVNVMYGHRNCGRCKNRCKKGSFCKYGMCSYA